MLDIGEVVHVIERRSFLEDLRRHFVGVIERADAMGFRASGYTFIFDSNSDTYVRSPERRTRVFPMGSPGLIINVAPEGTNIEKVRYVDVNRLLTVTDHGVFSLTVNEFGTRH